MYLYSATTNIPDCSIIIIIDIIILPNRFDSQSIDVVSIYLMLAIDITIAYGRFIFNTYNNTFHYF